MKVKIINDRNEYIKTEIERSSLKFDFCKVTVKDVVNFKKVLIKEHVNRIEGPIICLGTRNGREIDLFRNVFFCKKIYTFLISFFEIKRKGFISIFPWIEGFRRSNINNILNNSAVGVEVNPEASRKDTLICSFDDMPKEWQGKFKIIYSNSFDQSQDPVKTANEWKRIAAPAAIIFLGFTHTPPTDADPVGDLELEDFQQLFGGKIIYFSDLHGVYKNVAIKLD